MTDYITHANGDRSPCVVCGTWVLWLLTATGTIEPYEFESGCNPGIEIVGRGWQHTHEVTE
jgi:hypothetical protein